MSTIKLTQPQTERLRRLLHMEYTLTELAAELDCPRRILENAVKAGCPQRREGTRLYLVGDHFAAWYHAQPAAARLPLPDDCAYCLRCRAARQIVAPTRSPNSPGVVLLQGTCAVCGARVNRLCREAVA